MSRNLVEMNENAPIIYAEEFSISIGPTLVKLIPQDNEFRDNGTLIFSTALARDLARLLGEHLAALDDALPDGAAMPHTVARAFYNKKKGEIILANTLDDNPGFKKFALSAADEIDRVSEALDRVLGKHGKKGGEGNEPV